jgi:hypothetical protein
MPLGGGPEKRNGVRLNPTFAANQQISSGDIRGSKGILLFLQISLLKIFKMTMSVRRVLGPLSRVRHIAYVPVKQQTGKS